MNDETVNIQETNTQTKTKKTRLEVLQEKKLKLDEQIKSIQQTEKKKQRTIENRRKILIGAMILNQIEQKKISKEKIDSMLAEFLTNQRDRELFDLPEVPARTGQS